MIKKEKKINMAIPPFAMDVLCTNYKNLKKGLTILKPEKFGLPDINIHQFSYSKQLIHSKRYL